MGLILVFDMDQTILDSSDPYLFERPNTPEAHIILKQKIRDGLNWNVVNILRRAANLRPSGKVTAICLLTNNSSEILVSAVDEVLYEETGNSRGRYKTYELDGDDRTMPEKPYFFDSIMMRQHSFRKKTVDDNPPKRIIDIWNMMYFLGIEGNMENMKDIYFFDDIGTHVLRNELNSLADGKYSDHYIQINPPFRSSLPDRTNYDSILRALSLLDGQPFTKSRTVIQSPPSINLRQTRKLPSAPPPLNLTATGRPRSNAKVNENNLGLPPPPQEQSVRAKGTMKRPSLLGAFSTKGGSRYKKSRKSRHLQRKGARRATKKNH